jgi:hypothetical protein
MKMGHDNVLVPVSNALEAEMAKVAQRCIMAGLDHSRAPKIVLVADGDDTRQAPQLNCPLKPCVQLPIC